MSAHSKWGASSYSRWKACPASVKLSEGIVSPVSEHALRGTKAHDIAEKMLRDKFFGEGTPNIPPNYPHEDLDSIKFYVKQIKKDSTMYGCEASNGHVLIEQKFNLDKIHEGLFGTADCVLYSKEDKKLIVYDYKHGTGIAVDVKENVQLMYYGLGALINSGLPCKKIELVIIQPRAEHEDGPVRRWEIDAARLIDFSADLQDDVKRTLEEDPEVNPGSHCRFCPAAATKCPALRKQARQVARQEFLDIDTIKDQDIEKIAEALNLIPRLKDWIKRVEEYAFEKASHGNKIPGYKLVKKRSQRKWLGDEKEIIDFLENFFDEEEYLDVKIKSPAQVEKLLETNERKELQEIIDRESNGYTLVNETDRRTEVNIDARTDFKKITKMER